VARHIVHIGYHKTATTWFQECFYPFVRNMRFISRADARRALLEPSAFEFDPALAREALGVRSDESFIICEENLSGYIHNAGLHGLLSKDTACRIQAAIPDAEIVVFLRSQPEIIAGAYQQYVRGGGTHRPYRYLFPEDVGGASKYQYKVPRFSFEHFAYDRLLGHYRELFGRERLHVFLYEEFRADPRAFVESFRARFGFDVDMGAISFASVNPSYSRPVLEVARLLNRFTERSVADKHYFLNVRGWYRRRRRILRRLMKMKSFSGRTSPETLLGSRTVAWIRQYYWESNARLARDFDLPLAKYGYVLSPPPAPVERPSAESP
jgi:hypothetical protein